MPTDHIERGFETVVASLTAGGYEQAAASGFDAKLALDSAALVRFLKASQPAEWAKLAALYGTEVEERVERTESGMNGVSASQLPEKFGGENYHLLIVAEKYQTGFDQPLLHTMYVDKRLDGLQAVQTLSRLNRTCPGKEDTFVLDFANRADDIRNAFKPYFEATEIEECVEPNRLYELKRRLEDFQVYHAGDVLDFAGVFFRPAGRHRPHDQAALHRAIDPAVKRYDAEPAERRADFRALLGTYLKLYSFLSQVVDFTDADLERLYAYGRLLLTKLKADGAGGALDLDDDVRLTYYRVAVTHEGGVALAAGQTTPVAGPASVGTGRAKEEDIAALSEIVGALNERFGTEFTRADQLWSDQVIEDMSRDEGLGEQARNSPIENFRLEFDPKVMDAVVARIERNSGIASQFFSNEELRALAVRMMMAEVYKRLQAGTAPEGGR